VLVAAALVAPARAAARVRVVAFGCKITGGRARILVPRAAEEARSDDELRCWANLDGLARGGRAPVAAELRILAPDGKVRTVATGAFETSRDRPGRAWLDQMFVPHWTWSSGVDWRAPARPVLRLELRVSAHAPGRRGRWLPVADARLDLRGGR
jgi:hypothetical protein